MRIALVSLHTSPGAVPGSGDAGGMNVVVAAAAHALADRGHEVVAVTRASAELPAGEYPLGRGDTGCAEPASPVSASATAAGPAKPAGRAAPADRSASADGATPSGWVEPAGRAPRADRATPAGSRSSRVEPRLVALPAGDPGLRKSALPGVVPEFAAGLRALGDFDAVHAHYWLSGVAALEAFGDAGPGLAITFHTLAAQKNERLAPGDTPEPAERVAGERALAERSFLVAASDTELAAVRAHCGEPGLGAAVVHPGVDTELFRPARTGVDAQESPLRIAVLGRVQPLKGQDLAVRAAAELASIDPELWARTELVIAGEPTPGAEDYAASLRAIAEEHGISDRVRFLPAQTRTEAAELLAGSTVVLVPSHSETFGLTALEACASGVPVVVGGHTGLVEAAPDGAAGIHMSDRDPRNWALAVRGLLADPHRRAQIGRSAREHALLHDWRTHAARLEHIYASLPRH